MEKLKPLPPPHQRRWRGAQSPTLLEQAFVWVAFTLFVVIILGAICAALWVIVP